MELGRAMKMSPLIQQIRSMSVLVKVLIGPHILLKALSNGTSSKQSEGNWLGEGYNLQKSGFLQRTPNSFPCLRRSGIKFPFGCRKCSGWSDEQDFYQNLFDHVDAREETARFNKDGKIMGIKHKMEFLNQWHVDEDMEEDLAMEKATTKQMNADVNGADAVEQVPNSSGEKLSEKQQDEQVPEPLRRSFLATLALSDPNVVRPDPPNDERRDSYRCADICCGRLKWEDDINCPPIPKKCLERFLSPKDLNEAIEKPKRFSAATKEYFYRWFGRKLK